MSGFAIEAHDHDHRILVRVEYQGGGDLERLKSALTNAYATAFAELEERVEASHA